MNSRSSCCCFSHSRSSRRCCIAHCSSSCLTCSLNDIRDGSSDRSYSGATRGRFKSGKSAPANPLGGVTKRCDCRCRDVEDAVPKFIETGENFPPAPTAPRRAFSAAGSPKSDAKFSIPTAPFRFFSSASRLKSAIRRVRSRFSISFSARDKGSFGRSSKVFGRSSPRHTRTKSFLFRGIRWFCFTWCMPPSPRSFRLQDETPPPEPLLLFPPAPLAIIMPFTSPTAFSRSGQPHSVSHIAGSTLWIWSRLTRFSASEKNKTSPFFASYTTWWRNTDSDRWKFCTYSNGVHGKSNFFSTASRVRSLKQWTSFAAVPMASFCTWRWPL
mmetsp:Transcript_7426/g.17941  ORF Transcript_7426/g.17941 Transcript_7426/m.17941 type:complete len:327 (+) Transcript_7426:811-1791(+)